MKHKQKDPNKSAAYRVAVKMLLFFIPCFLGFFVYIIFGFFELLSESIVNVSYYWWSHLMEFILKDLPSKSENDWTSLN